MFFSSIRKHTFVVARSIHTHTQAVGILQLSDKNGGGVRDRDFGVDEIFEKERKLSF